GVDEGGLALRGRLDQRGLRDLLQLRLDEVEVAGLAAAGRGIDDDHGVVALEQLVGEMDALDAEVRHGHAFGEILVGQAADRRAPGRRRTFAPLATGTPSMVTVSVSGFTAGSLAGSHIGDDSAGRLSSNSSPKGRCSPNTGTPSAPVPNSGMPSARDDPA